MKTDIGVDPEYAIDRDDPELDSALRKLRPDVKNTTTFREYIKNDQDDQDSVNLTNPIISDKNLFESQTSNHRKLGGVISALLE